MPTSGFVDHVLLRMPVLVAALASAKVAMQASFTENGTYAGATMPAGSGTTIVRADETSFCLQYAGDAVMHLVCPNGQAVDGPC